MDDLKNIFISNPEIDKNAYLNWRFNKYDSNEEKFIELGSAYFEVAIHLIEICKKDNDCNRLDGWIFPILFDIYQGLELYLKAYNHYLNPEGNMTARGHNIKSICECIFNKLQELKTKYKDDGKKTEIGDIYEEFKVVRKFIIMLYDNTTADISFSRYPLNTDMEDFFYIGGKEELDENNHLYMGNITIDIERLSEWINCIYSILEKHIYYWKDVKNLENNADT